ncbi:hypothetical protein LMG33818_000890 [Halomonadaceae bacterium LMG 33818]|uniref:hypothetical protein n=1 Tax=Cernens ardua TaxID=3402176 RepID=UPI003EDCADE1
MGLRDRVQGRLAKAFAGPLADAVEAFTGEHKDPSAGHYDPVTETYTGGTTTYKGQGVFDNFAITTLDGVNLKAGDQLLIVLANQVERKPEVGDTINGYDVKTVNEDPAAAHYECLLRKA